MLAMLRDGDFFTSYKLVSNKLKKRFMKKPNYSEASNEFNQIAKSLSNNGLHAYSAFCCQAVARCEQAMGNTTGQIFHLLKATKSFLEAHKCMENLHCPNGSEFLISSLCCCDTIVKICTEIDLPVEAASLCWELGEWLENNHQYDKAICQFQHCIPLHAMNPLQSSLAHKKLMTLCLLLNDYHSALKHGTTMLETCQVYSENSHYSPLGSYSKLLSECEITLILLIMLLNPHPFKVKEKHSSILKKYTWHERCYDGAHSTKTYMDKNLFILMQSVVIACSGKDVSVLRILKDELSVYFTPEQADLMDKIISEFDHPSGMGF